MLSQKDVKSLHKKNKSGRLMLSQKVMKRPGWNHEIAIGWRSNENINYVVDVYAILGKTIYLIQLLDHLNITIFALCEVFS